MNENTDNSRFTFTPRNEARVMSWNELMRPVQEAVRELLVHLAGIQKKTADSKYHNGDAHASANAAGNVANSFLIGGTRGTGKTTVLHCAQAAVGRTPTLFPMEKNEKDDLLFSAREASKLLESVVWLPILDLETLHPKANLLTALLTRLRNALTSPPTTKNGESTSRSPISNLFEEQEDGPCQQLERLISDSTQLWEEFRETDTRVRAERQINAANVYAEFRDRFEHAMDALLNEIGRRSTSSRPAIVLPIDNIDRSTEHLGAIVKLAQMVSYDRLWLVMAGDRHNIDIFLERVFWIELISTPYGIDASGKIGRGNEDETLVMARRQAIATGQNLLPPGHRVEINSVEPTEVLLHSSLESHEEGEEQKRINAIGELLKDVDVLTGGRQPDRSDEKNQGESKELFTLKLYHFFDIDDLFQAGGLPLERMREATSETEPAQGRKDQPFGCLTRAAHGGLLLPARMVIDLWQLTHWMANAVNVTRRNRGYQAEKIARTVLRNAIQISNLPSTNGIDLQEEIIRRTQGGGTLLDFRDFDLKVTALTSPILTLDISSPPTSTQTTGEKERFQSIRSKVAVGRTADVRFSVSRRNSLESDKPEAVPDLPPEVSAWLSVLHDILLLADSEAESAVITPFVDRTVEPVSTRHEWVDPSNDVFSAKFSWPTPDWDIFLMDEIFSNYLETFTRERLSQLRTKKASTDDDRVADEQSARLLAAVWIDFVLETFRIRLVIGGCDNPAERGRENKSQRESVANSRFEKSASDNGNPVDDPSKWEKKVIGKAAKIYKKVMAFPPEKIKKLSFMVDWLQEALPLFLSNLYVPLDDTRAEERIREIIGELKDTDLLRHWEDNRSFILAKLRRRLINPSISPKKRPVQEEKTSEPPPPPAMDFYEWVSKGLNNALGTGMSSRPD